MSDDLDAFIQEQKSKLAEERKNLNKPAPSPRNQPELKPPIMTRPDTPESGGALLLGLGSEEKRRKLQEERKREYNELLARNGGPVKGRDSESVSAPDGLPVGGYDEKRKQLQKQRQEEYNNLLKKQENQQRRKLRTPDNGGLPLGAYQEKRKHLEEERKQEYNALLAKQGRGARNKENQPPATPDQSGFMGKLGQYEQQRQRLQNERKVEYNQQLIQPPLSFDEPSIEPTHQQPPSTNQLPPANVEPKTKPSDTDGGLKERELYLEFLQKKSEDLEKKIRQLSAGATRAPPPVDTQPRANNEIEDFRAGPRRGWATPTYEEILDKKRQEERAYRRHDDPTLYLGGEAYNRASTSDGQLNKPFDDSRFKELDREYETKKVRFYDERRKTSLLDDPNWLSDGLDDVVPDVPLSLSRSRSKPEFSTQRPPQSTAAPPPPRAGRRTQGQPDGYQATLLVGGQNRTSADQRKKDVYRRELEEQMAQLKQNKLREKQEDLRYNLTGASDVARAPPPASRPAPAQRNPQPPPPAPNDFSQPGLIGGYPSPLDEAYYYYGMRNPLDPQTALGGAPIPPDGIGLASAPTAAPPPQVSYQQQSRTAPAPPVNTYQYEPQQPTSSRRQPPGGASNLAGVSAFPVDNPDQAKVDAKRKYQEELQRQMEEMRQKKEREKREKEEYDRKLDEEIRNYNPFGKGGGGAPMRDQYGNLIADLNTMHRENEQVSRSPDKTPRYGGGVTPNPYATPRSEVPKDPNDHARGGHGIFGEALTDGQKHQRDVYQEELKRQIDEKKRKDAEQKEKERLEDERLARKIEEDNRRIQEEFEAEKRKEREKQEEAQKQQLDLARLQEEKRKEAERKRMEEDDKRIEDARRQDEQRRAEREAREKGENGGADRLKSPPIPTLADKQPVAGTSSGGGGIPRSPPVPAVKTRSIERKQSADVLSQLSRMRQQLQSERVRVEKDLERQIDEPEVYDPRIYARPLPQNVDIFEVARTRERSRTKLNDPDDLREFRNLKKGESESRQALRSMFPQSPTSIDGLETQQRALLLEQEEQLEALRRGKKQPSTFEKQLPGMEPKDLGLIRAPSTASAQMLESDSDFIAVPDDDFYDQLIRSRSRNESARSRRRSDAATPTSRYNPSINSSMVSLDAENLNRRNEERLRRLKSLAGDDISTSDPDDILERFMSKNPQHKRPPSGNTLVDDSWLRPGTRTTIN